MTVMRARVIGLAAGVALASATGLSAQQSRDAAAVARGPATLTGVVVTDDGGRPVEHALVTVKGLAPAFALATSTDAQGRFAFTGLPASDVTVTATKTAYLTAFYGARDRIRGPAVPFAFASASAQGIMLRLVRGAVIAGVVKGPTGRPVAGVRVTAQLSRLTGGARRVVAGAQGQGGVSDDLGRYRIWGLVPGEYLIEATPTDAQTSLRTMPESDASTTAATPPRMVRFAPVYFPGVTDASQAAAISIGAGQERDDVNVGLQPVPTADLRGVVIGTDGRPAPHVPVEASGGLELLSDVSDEAGRFVFRGVSPGNLTVSAGGAIRDVRRGLPAETQWAALAVSVNGEDQSNLSLMLQPGMRASGRVTFEGAGVQMDPSRAMIVLVPAVGDRPGIARIAQSAPSTDGAFTVPDLAPGRYHLRPAYTGDAASSPASPSSPWLVKSVLWQGQDLLDGTLDISPGQDVNGLTVVFSDRQTDLHGTFFDSASHPVAGYDVVVFAADRRFWTPESRRVKRVLLGRDGHFDFSGLPAGAYLLAAVTHADDDDLADPDWLDGIAPLALPVTLADGEHKIQDIRLGK